MPRPPTLRAFAGATLLGLVLSACSGDGAPRDDAPVEPAAQATPLAAYDTTAVAVARSAFCNRISAEAVRDALGDAADTTSEWEPGGQLEGRGLPDDTSHEWGCRWETDDGLGATAWLLAPPVTVAQARDLLASAPGCWRAEGESFGRPSAAIRCGEEGGGRVEIGHRGLFGDAWLSCTLSARGEEPEDFTERAERWCVQVLEATRVR